MGTCCVGSSGEPSDQATCSEIGGDYYDGQEESCIRGCALLTFLTNYLSTEYGEDPIVLLAAGGTYTALYDVRDEVLLKSATGRQLLDYYARHSGRILSVLEADPTLLREALRLFLVAAGFGRAVLRAKYGIDREMIGDRRFTDAMYQSGLALVRNIRAGSEGEFDQFLSFLEEQAQRFVGMNPWEILDTLQREEAGGSS